MTIDNQRGQGNVFNSPLGSPAEAHSLIALEQSALYAARVAIARWSASSCAAVASIEAAAPSLKQAPWYAQAQENFQQWLARGGFAQYDVAAPAACLSCVADGDACVTPLPGHADAAGI